MGFPLSGGSFPVDSLAVEANVGRTDVLTGQGTNPVIELRASNSAGAQWGAWRPAALGSQGNYRTRAQVRRWGRFDFPGFLAEGRCTDPVPLRVSGVYVNEPGGGRLR